MKKFQKLLMWISFGFIGVVAFTFTIGQSVPIEFLDWQFKSYFYDVLFLGTPIVMLLSFFWTLKKSRAFEINMLIIALTILSFLAIFFSTIIFAFDINLSIWKNEKVLFKNVENPDITINDQLYERGAFGDDAKRIVKLTPLFFLWNRVEVIDTSSIDLAEWNLIYKK